MATASLSRRERQIMDFLHRRRAATAAEVRAGIADPPGYSSVRVLLRILEEKGHVRHRTDGPRYIYEPIEARATARRSAVRHVVDTFFGGSRTAAAAALLNIARTVSAKTRPNASASSSNEPNARDVGMLASIVSVTNDLVGAAHAASVVLLSTLKLRRPRDVDPPPAALGALMLLRRGPASARHAVWAGAILVLGALPALTPALPPIALPVPGVWPTATHSFAKTVSLVILEAARSSGRQRAHERNGCST